MASIIGAVGSRLEVASLDGQLKDAAKLLAALVDADAYVGEVYSLGYESALVQVHDFHRQQVGGIPALSFLLATRIAGGSDIDVRAEDSSVILLRVLDQADLPNASEALRVRVENAQTVSGETSKHWDPRATTTPRGSAADVYQTPNPQTPTGFHTIAQGRRGHRRAAVVYGAPWGSVSSKK